MVETSSNQTIKQKSFKIQKSGFVFTFLLLFYFYVEK